MPVRLAKGRPVNAQRYCVFSLVDNTIQNHHSLHINYDICPLTSALEAAKVIRSGDHYKNKRMKSYEKQVAYPYIDATFFTSFMNKDTVAELIKPEDCVNLHFPDILLEKGCYEEIQMVDPKKDMVDTPIDEDPLALGHDIAPIGRTTPEQERLSKGYIVNAYKTMEDMDSDEFMKTWKTWTGVRYICMQLPRELGLRRISFWRALKETTNFKYVLLIEISNLAKYAADTLNLIDRLKLKLCGFIGVYRSMEFTIDPKSAEVFGKGTKNQTPPRVPTPPMSVVVPLPGERFLTMTEKGKATVEGLGKSEQISLSDTDEALNKHAASASAVVATANTVSMTSGINTATSIDNGMSSSGVTSPMSGSRHAQSIPVLSQREKNLEMKLIARCTGDCRGDSISISTQNPSMTAAPRAVEEDLDGFEVINDGTAARRKSPLGFKILKSRFKPDNPMKYTAGGAMSSSRNEHGHGSSSRSPGSTSSRYQHQSSLDDQLCRGLDPRRPVPEPAQTVSPSRNYLAPP